MITDKFLRKIVSNNTFITSSMITEAEKQRKNCKCKNRYFIEHRTSDRDYIEKSSNSDLKYQINSMGMLASENAYGEIANYCPDCKKILPVICGHGGSMWLCRKCANRIIKLSLKNKT